MTEREELDRLNKEIKFHEEQLIQELELKARLAKRLKPNVSTDRRPVFGQFDSIRINIVTIDEVEVKDAPRSGAPWSPFETDHLDKRFAEFLHEKAKKQGRTTKAIRYKLLYFLLRDLPLEDLFKKVKQMVSEGHNLGG